jgi:hypothetical protein
MCIIFDVLREEFCARSQKSSVAPDDCCCMDCFPKMILESFLLHCVCILLCFSMTNCEANKLAKDGMILIQGFATLIPATLPRRLRLSRELIL